MEVYDLIVIGGGQSGLACGYFLRGAGLKYIILDIRNPDRCGAVYVPNS